MRVLRRIQKKRRRRRENFFSQNFRSIFFFIIDINQKKKERRQHKMNLDSICRVCLSSGSRNIFEKSSASNDSQFSIPAIGENVSSLDRLVEKLRYVTMLKVSEFLGENPHFPAHSFHLAHILHCKLLPVAVPFIFSSFAKGFFLALSFFSAVHFCCGCF